jgi:hypothetical protein
MSKVGNDVLLPDDERIVECCVCPKYGTIISGQSLIDTKAVNQATELFIFFLVPLVVKHLSFFKYGFLHWSKGGTTIVQYISKSNLLLSANIIPYAV